MKRWTRPSLRARILLPLAGLVMITLGGGAVMIWWTYRIEGLFASVLETNVSRLRTAAELETALMRQKGFVSYYFLDGDPTWLKQLEESRQAFKRELLKARESSPSEPEQNVLGQIESDYEQYTREKDRVIALYQAGDREAGSLLHQEVRAQFSRILELCDRYKDLQYQMINRTWKESHQQAQRLRVIAGTAMTGAVILGAFLAFMLVTEILRPIRNLTVEADRAGAGASSVSGNEVAALKKRVRGLIYDVEDTHTELRRSRERLLQSEKMALVGKLAAEVAHTIRNPMTSIKMRLFSLERTLELSPTQREDFKVVAEEMRHLDNIVRNFLEFSRPPKLKMQPINVSEVVDAAMQLLQSRFELLGLQVERNRHYLPNVLADPELLREVLVNLLVNACDAMGQGGRLQVTETEAVAERIGRAVVIAILDTGPGIPEALLDKVFEPFFSTKPDGTGLGLAIAQRVVEEHGGRLDLRSREGEGATFIITLPVPEESG